MRFGKFEIDTFVCGLILIAVAVMTMIGFQTKLDIEKERTKQLEIEARMSISQDTNNE